MLWVHWENLSGQALINECCELEELDSYFRHSVLQPFSCLKYTYYYDDTLYNYHQTEEVEKELSVLATIDLPETARKELHELIAFINRIPRDGRKECILKFYGE